MTARGFASAAALLLLAALASSPVARGQGNPVTPYPKVPLRWDRFYDYKEMGAALEALDKAHPGWLDLRSIGKSAQGRNLVLAVLNDPAGPSDRLKPAIYIDANVHGNEIQGTEVCLYTLWYLLENRELPRLKELLARVAFYVVPTVNPDGRESWFHDPSTPHTPRTGLLPVDDDRDGLKDEDGPNDLDGDGSITSMRKRVESGGTHRVHPDDPRVLVRVKPGEDGEYLSLGWEGIDDDGDGEINEDGPGGYDMNRNWPADWQPAWIQGGAGPYPLAYPETRAIADFLLARPNVAAVQSYHNTGGMILRGPGHKSVGDYPRPDAAVYDELGRTGERMLPHYDYKVLHRDLYPVRGGFVTWAFEGLGIFSFTNELWSREQYLGEDGPDSGGTSRGDRRAARLEWDDEMEFGKQFAPWKPYDHPFYGKIEVGGLKKASGRVPPTFMLEELCHRNMAFTLYHADQMPLLELSAPEVEKLEGGLVRVRAEVRNRRVIPTISEYARRNRIGLPDFFEIEVVGGAVVAGGRLEGDLLRPRVVPQPHRPHRLRLDRGVPSQGSVRVEWIVAADGDDAPEIKLRYVSRKGGTVNRP